MIFIRSVTSIAINGVNHFNITNFRISGSTVAFTLMVKGAVIQKFCVTGLACDINVLKQNLLLNASATPTTLVNSSSLTDTLSANVNGHFGIKSIYGPIYDYKCVMGLSAFSIDTNGSTHSLYFDFTAALNANSTVDNSSSYLLEYKTFCFVNLQCQYLYQQYYVLINDCQDACNLPNCITCNTGTSCVECQPQYFLNSVQRCDPCIGNCSICSNTVTCDTCISGYYFDSGNGSCLPCEVNCLTCTASSCRSCPPAYYPSLKTCKLCENAMSNCIECSVSNICQKCRTGYAFSSDRRSCLACSRIANCK